MFRIKLNIHICLILIFLGYDHAGYVNDSDGPTKLYNFDKTKVVKEVHPKTGRVLIFDGLTYHASSSPKDHPSRIVVNYNFDGTTLPLTLCKI